MDDKFKNTTIGELMAAQKQAQMEEPVSLVLSGIKFSKLKKKFNRILPNLVCKERG